MLGPIISNMAGDACSVMTSRDPKGQGHSDLDRNMIFRDGTGQIPCSLNVILLLLFLKFGTVSKSHVKEVYL